jgi:hypothetical protein
MPEEHSCAFDFHAEGSKNLSANLLRVAKAKVGAID